MQRLANVFNDSPFKRLKNIFLDATLRTEDGAVFHVHRLQLALRNNYFKAMFCGHFSNSTDVLIRGIDKDTMEAVLYYLYTNNVALDRDNVMDIWIAADYLLLDSLKKLCREFVLQELDNENCLGVFLTVWKIDGLGLVDECYRYLTVHFNDVFQDCFIPCKKSSEKTTLVILRDLPFEALKKILENRSLNIMGERCIWYVIVAWFGSDYFKKQQYVLDLLKCMYREDVDGSLSTEIQDSPIVKHHPLCIKESDIKTSQMLLKTYTSGSRSPSMIYFVAHYCMLGNNYYLDLYLTFDNKLDVWRKLATNVALCPDFLIQMGHNIYMFDAWENRSLAFNILDCSRHSMPPLKHHRYRYVVVSVAKFIYVLGGAVEDFEYIDTIERFDPSTNAWDTVTPMHPMILAEVVVLKGCIYAIGDVGEETNPTMMVQVYNPESDLWYVVEAPKIFRHDFTAAVYREKLYVIGGEDQDSILTSVEEYNPQKDSWKMLPDLPFKYCVPKAIELEGRMIVYENHLRNRRLGTASPPVFWDTYEESWVAIEESSPLINMHLYQFCAISLSTVLKDLVRQSRLSGAEWAKISLA